MTTHDHNIDKVTGTPTTGHEWDGLQELNTPLPRWWLWTFYLTIIWSVGYWVVYPAWPLLSSATEGMLGWHTRTAVVEDLAALNVQRGPLVAKLEAASLDEIARDPQMLEFARAQGRAAFADNCAPCHGTGGSGAKGYPNLNDDDWLWGGKLADISQTIQFGVRSAHDKSRAGAMPAFGRDKILKSEEISEVADHVRALAGLSTERGFNPEVGRKVFADNCAVCHGEQGKGNRELGAPDLTDRIWLYGSDKQTIMDGIRNGRGAVMPHWAGRLNPSTIKALTVYVHTLGGGEK
ncbi:MAG: cytochrome-c oxidase, cbb3-type subunit III [Pseudolabrys sp.]|nr:cytochrome-c oxidase, cbb3-type subunit III [Pseudolabrys sp.]MBV9956610.1 cytochrome-c oxidase, cbb3-type subunit III [Pseudolabrys sp.]